MKEFKNGKLYNGDCLEIMKDLEDKSIDLIACDLPYGTTACAWDVIIPFESLWDQYERIIKDNGAIILTASQPFTTDLINSNRKLFRYEMIWYKNTCTGIAQSSYMPMKNHENILVFYKKKPIFNKQLQPTKSEHISICAKKGLTRKINTKGTQLESLGGFAGGDFKEYVNPRSVIDFIKTVNNRSKDKTHPTQKPIELMEYIIRTYSNEGDVVLDNCSGSGTTGIAAINTNRMFILIEQDIKHFYNSVNRISEHIL